MTGAEAFGFAALTLSLFLLVIGCLFEREPSGFDGVGVIGVALWVLAMLSFAFPGVAHWFGVMP